MSKSFHINLNLSVWVVHMKTLKKILYKDLIKTNLNSLYLRVICTKSQLFRKTLEEIMLWPNPTSKTMVLTNFNLYYFRKLSCKSGFFLWPRSSWEQDRGPNNHCNRYRCSFSLSKIEIKSSDNYEKKIMAWHLKMP
jgi:hypothetical protein